LASPEKSNAEHAEAAEAVTESEKSFLFFAVQAATIGATPMPREARSQTKNLGVLGELGV